MVKYRIYSYLEPLRGVSKLKDVFLDLLCGTFYRYPYELILQSSLYRDPVKEILRTFLYSSQRELAEDALVFVSHSLQLVSLAGIIRMVCRTSPPSHIITARRKLSVPNRLK